MLTKIGKVGEEYCLGEKCQHSVTDGRWMVLKGEEVFVFDPPTQMQKDFWLIEGEDRSKEEHERRIGQLRWICFQCNNIQEP